MLCGAAFLCLFAALEALQYFGAFALEIAGTQPATGGGTLALLSPWRDPLFNTPVRAWAYLLTDGYFA